MFNQNANVVVTNATLDGWNRPKLKNPKYRRNVIFPASYYLGEPVNYGSVLLPHLKGGGGGVLSDT